MKNLLTAILPALALLALGGCAGTSALTSSEDDGVYYSSQDRTTAIVSTAPAPASTDEAANPDYNGNAASSSSRQSSGSDQYYDNTYTYMRGVPNYGVTYYTPYSPYTTLSYAYGAGACGFSPFGYGLCDPFYSPYYSPYYGFNSGISISFGFGRPWGYGGGYYGYGRPYYGYGYGGGFYDPYYYNGPYYGGYYSRGGYYGSSYYGGNSYYGNNRYYGNENARGRTSGHRTDRQTDGRNNSGTAANVPNAITPSNGGRVRSEQVLAPGVDSQPSTRSPEVGRTRTETVGATPGLDATRTNEAYNQPRRINREEQPRYRDMNPANQPVDVNNGQVVRDANRGRWRGTDAAPTDNGQAQPSAAPQETQRRRGGFFQNSLPQSADGQAAEPARPQRSYEQPRQRSYEQPQQQQRAYEQPQRTYEQPQQRSYEQPQRSSQPSGESGGGGGRSRGRAD
jgi:hypothetical protein